MRTHTTTETLKTVCGKTISYLQTTGQVNKMHSVEGPAVIYAEGEKKASEYYLFGIKYSKNEWKSLITQHKALPIENAMGFDTQY